MTKEDLADQWSLQSRIVYWVTKFVANLSVGRTRWDKHVVMTWYWIKAYRSRCFISLCKFWRDREIMSSGKNIEWWFGSVLCSSKKILRVCKGAGVYRHPINPHILRGSTPNKYMYTTGVPTNLHSSVFRRYATKETSDSPPASWLKSRENYGWVWAIETPLDFIAKRFCLDIIVILGNTVYIFDSAPSCRGGRGIFGRGTRSRHF